MSHTGGGSSPSSPCGACRLFRWKCTAECVFAPYFPAAEALKFAYVHEIFKASKVIKILHDLPESIRADAMTLLAFDAEARMKEHGWMFHGCALHRRTMELQEEVPELREQINYFEDREQRRISQGSSGCLHRRDLTLLVITGRSRCSAGENLSETQKQSWSVEIDVDLAVTEVGRKRIENRLNLSIC
ncbi:hypothetical protein AXG93_3891s1040 [Marchantia polymorpha subsp. ruderalis]|uniref:LOB domain-containing protein n=1 Tax=Marchantia polymorpha subsp. ruderalis TaxID=1480154 RepID=A0A176WMX8_MARPO|nr:hypothetical protein AXG93_3891s1040 [Marchantia polymorpha subsp. ruderalis]